jgi:uncharacterized protein
MRTRLRRDLIVAMEARDDVAVVALRSAIAAIDNAEAVEVREASRHDESLQMPRAWVRSIRLDLIEHGVLMHGVDRRASADEAGAVPASAEFRRGARADGSDADHRDGYGRHHQTDRLQASHPFMQQSGGQRDRDGGIQRGEDGHDG